MLTLLRRLALLSQPKGNVALDPDGLNATFYHHYWGIIGKDITNITLNILNRDGNVSNINQTFICLIPKKDNAISTNDYRPIYLCNVMLKIISKTIANRVKPHMD